MSRSFAVATAPPAAISSDTRRESGDVVEDDEEEAEATTIRLSSSSDDICQALMDRYARSSAPQHRHLCASAAAMRSILAEEGLPLTLPAYFAAAITALRDNSSDPDALSALAAFLSILLPLLPTDSLPPQKAKAAAFVLAPVLKNPPAKTATGTVRSMIKSLGLLALRVDPDDWNAVELPLETLLVFAVDKRPKVRRCAQVCVDNVFKALQSSTTKKASKVILLMYRKYIPMVEELTSIKIPDAELPKSGEMVVLHMLNILKVVVPYLSEKVKMKILSDVCKFMDGCFSWHTRHILSLLECLLEHSKVRVLVPESVNIISALTSYVSVGEKNPSDTVIRASTLLKNVLCKLRDAQPDICLKYLPPIVISVTGLFGYDVTSKHAAHILEELINIHIDPSILRITANQSRNDEKKSTREENAVTSICTVFDNMLGACQVPTEYMLAVIAVLFLKLGECSYLFMKEIVLKLSRCIMCVDEDMTKLNHLQVCIGAAVVAMGPEKFLSLIPISFNAEELTCSNTWLIPILKKYVAGGSLQYFMECIVPLAKSLQEASTRVVNVKVRGNLQSYSCGLWNLLPSFCCYPKDTSRNFESLAKLLIVILKDEPSLHETVAIALQEFVNENRSILEGNLDIKRCADPPISFIFKDLHIEPTSLPFHYSKKTASRNMKALSSHSFGLFQAFTDIFFDSPPKKRKYMKETIACLASVIGSESLQHFFVSSTEKFKPIDALDESRKLEGKMQASDQVESIKSDTEREKHEVMRSLLMELTSCFVKIANPDLIDLIFDYLRSSLMGTDATCHCEAYCVLSVILKEHNWFSAARIEELLDLVLNIKSSNDGGVLKNRLSCFRYLLVHMLTSDKENMDARAFLILNEIILILKSKKESRKLAYDVLLEISHSLKNSQPGNSETELLRLFNMVMGYLSSSSPHIMSGAISALSLLIFNDACFCLAVPNLIPSVLVLLQNKDNEVIKASLGFIKVLVSSLSSNDLPQLLTDILNGICPWLTVSKHHFRSKVAIILEILMRKCGSDTVESIVPEKYQQFVKKITKARQSKKNTKVDENSVAAVQSADSDAAVQSVRGPKRLIKDISGPAEKSSRTASMRNKKWKDKGFSGTMESSVSGRVGTRKFSQRYNNSNSKDKFVARPNYRDKNKKIAVDKPRDGNIMNIHRKKDGNNLTHGAAASKSADAPFKFHKRKRTHGS